MAVDHQKLLELEMENTRLKDSLTRLQKAVASGEGGNSELSGMYKIPSHHEKIIGSTDITYGLGEHI